MKSRVYLIALCLIIVFSSFVYSLTYFDNWEPVSGYKYNENPLYIVNLSWDKPFIFRILTVMAARLIVTGFGLTPAAAVSSVILISSIFMFFSTIYFFERFTTKPIIAAFACSMLVMILTAYYRKIYDFSTVGFFCLSLGLLARRKFRWYYWLFLIATFNRETTFLLMIFFAVYYLGTMPITRYLFGIVYQAIVYALIKLFLTLAFWNNDGEQFAHNIRKYMSGYVEYPGWTFVVVGILLVVTFLAFRKWESKAIFLRYAFAVLFPLQIVLHILLGYAFEVRVLAESFPVVFLMCITTIESLRVQRKVALIIGGKVFATSLPGDRAYSSLQKYPEG